MPDAYIQLSIRVAPLMHSQPTLRLRIIQFYSLMFTLSAPFQCPSKEGISLCIKITVVTPSPVQLLRPLLVVSTLSDTVPGALCYDTQVWYNSTGTANKIPSGPSQGLLVFGIVIS
jgi:hypothetical protein